MWYAQTVYSFLIWILALNWTAVAADRSAAAELWKSRPLIVFSQSDAAAFREQESLFEGLGAQLEDRDMKLFLVTQPDHPWRGRYGIVDDSFEVILVGKDGGVKIRATEPLDPQRVFEVIDQMPMRRREMRTGR
jgi:uncharacterized protein DUF4174